MQDGELVTTATAGGFDPGALGTLVGQRMTFMPPLGVAFVAWMEGPVLEKWLAHVPEGAARDEERARVAGGPRTRLLRLGAHRCRSTRSPRRSTASPQTRAPWTATTCTAGSATSSTSRSLISDELKSNLGTVSVPVFAPDGTVAVVLTVRGFPVPCTVEDADRWIACVRSAGDRATEALAVADRRRPPTA